MRLFLFLDRHTEINGVAPVVASDDLLCQRYGIIAIDPFDIKIQTHPILFQKRDLHFFILIAIQNFFDFFCQHRTLYYQHLIYPFQSKWHIPFPDIFQQGKMIFVDRSDHIGTFKGIEILQHDLHLSFILGAEIVVDGQ